MILSIEPHDSDHVTAQELAGQPGSPMSLARVTKELEAQGWQRQSSGVDWRYYVGVEVYEIHLAVERNKVSHGSLWDVTTGRAELIATAYRATPPARRVEEILAWASDPSAMALGQPL